MIIIVIIVIIVIVIIIVIIIIIIIIVIIIDIILLTYPYIYIYLPYNKGDEFYDNPNNQQAFRSKVESMVPPGSELNLMVPSSSNLITYYNNVIYFFAVLFIHQRPSNSNNIDELLPEDVFQ